VLQEWGRTWGNFALSWCGSQTVMGVPDESLFTTLRNKGGWVYDRAVLEVKKEIPVDIENQLIRVDLYCKGEWS